MKGRREFWRAPSGRLHLHRRCSGNGRPRDTKKVRLTKDEFLASERCRCTASTERSWVQNVVPR